MKKSELKALLKIIAEEVIAAKKAKIEEAKALSGYKNTSDKVEHTEKIADSKSLTSTSKPVEKKEGKKLPVKDNKSNTETDHFSSNKSTPAAPSSEKEESKARPVGGHGSLKEEIMAMIRESIEEMARTAGAVGSKFKVQDPNSPTGWVVKGHKTIPDGTPTEAPKGPYVPKGDNPNMGRPKTSPSGIESDEEDDGEDDVSTDAVSDEVNTIVNVKIDGDEIGEIDFRKIKGTAAQHLNSILRANNFVLKVDPAVKAKLDDLSDMYVDDKLPAGATLDLSLGMDSIKLG